MYLTIQFIDLEKINIFNNPIVGSYRDQSKKIAGQE